MNYEALAQFLMSRGLVDPALFHGGRDRTFSVPPQATPAPERDVPLERMAPIPPAMPPLPTRKPMPPAAITEPRGGFGVTGPVTSADLEKRIRAVNSNPFVARGTDYNNVDPWGTLKRSAEWAYNRVTQPTPEINAPELDRTRGQLTDIAMLVSPIGRVAVPVKMGVRAIAQRKGLEKLQDVLETGYRRAWHQGPGVPRPAPAPRPAPQNLTEELQQIHRQVRRNNPPPPRRQNVSEYSAADKARVRQAALRRRADRTADQLLEKGNLDARARRLLELMQ